MSVELQAFVEVECAPLCKATNLATRLIYILRLVHYWTSCVFSVKRL